jgi:hypothetical protein
MTNIFYFFTKKSFVEFKMTKMGISIEIRWGSVRLLLCLRRKSTRRNACDKKCIIALFKKMEAIVCMEK